MPPIRNRTLITGSTGFLGGAVSAELIASDDWQDALLLVRASDPAAGVARVVANLSRFGVPDHLLKQVTERQICCGDLTDLKNISHDERLRQVTRVLNCAAVTSFGSHPRVFQTNVDGTLAFARLMARQPRLERFIQVGTAMICGAAPGPLVKENAYPWAGVDHIVEYTESKARAEILLRAELGDERLVVARPSIVVGHTRLGCQPSHSIFWAFRMSDDMQRVTGSVDGVIDVVPVDWTARALIALLRGPKLAHRVYHLSAGMESAVSFRQIGAAFAASRGEVHLQPYQQVSYADLVESQDRFNEWFGRCNRRFMLRAMKLYGAFAALDTRFDNSRILAEGVPAPPRFTDYLAVCQHSCSQRSLGELMVTDFQ